MHLIDFLLSSANPRWKSAVKRQVLSWSSEGFFPGGIVDFSRVAKTIFARERKIGEFLFYPLETMKITFFYWKRNRKMSDFKIQAGPTLPFIPFRRPSLQKPKAVYAANKWQYAAAGEVEVPCGGIHKWRKTEHGAWRYTDL